MLRLFRLIDYVEAMKKYSKELKESLIARMLPPGELF